MKSKYQQPKIHIIKVQTAQMIATSIDLKAEEATKPGMSRQGGSLWDDCDDDDDYDEQEDTFGYTGF